MTVSTFNDRAGLPAGTEAVMPAARRYLAAELLIRLRRGRSAGRLPRFGGRTITGGHHGHQTNAPAIDEFSLTAFTAAAVLGRLGFISRRRLGDRHMPPLSAR